MPATKEPFTVTCGNCKATLKVNVVPTKGDAIVEPDRNMAIMRAIICPMCKQPAFQIEIRNVL